MTRSGAAGTNELQDAEPTAQQSPLSKGRSEVKKLLLLGTKHDVKRKS